MTHIRMAQADLLLRLESLVAVTLNTYAIVSALNGGHLLRILHRRGLWLVGLMMLIVVDLRHILVDF